MAYRSASRTNGACEFSASLTRRTMPAYVLSAAVSLARRSNGPPAFTTPLRTWSPRACSAGRASPVSADSSRTAASEATMPSTGTTSPDATSSGSPAATSSSGTISTLPSR